MDYIAVQAYSQRWPNGDGTYAESFDPGGRYAPGAMQALAERKAKAAGFRAVLFGAAAYRQEFPSLSARDAMRIAYDASAGGIGRRWWSLKNVRRNEYAQQFLRETR